MTTAAEEVKGLKPYEYDLRLSEGIAALDTTFDTESYDDGSSTSNAALKAFWTDTTQSDLIRCIWPTVRDLRSGSIRPGYPKGGFDPICQALTFDGFDKLVDIAFENCTATTHSDRWSSCEGINSRVGSSSGVLNILGGAIKPIAQSVIIIDIDLDFFGSRILSPELVQWFLDHDETYRIRGNRQHLTIVARQSDCLKEHMNDEYADHSKLIFSHSAFPTAKIEVGFREGASANIFGAHKHRPFYQALLPKNDEIAEITAEECVELFELLLDSNFSNKKGDATNKDGRLLPTDIQDVEEFAPNIGDMLLLRDGVINIEKRFGIVNRVKLVDLLTANATEIMKGKLRYLTASHSVATDPADPFPISDGYRRNTTWQFFTDLSFTVQFLETFGITFDPDEEAELVNRIAAMVQPDIGAITLNVFDPVTATYQVITTEKWSADYVRYVYRFEYRNGDRSTVSYNYAHGFIQSVSQSLALILQNQLLATKIEKLAKSGKSLMPPTITEGVKLAATTTAYDVDDAVSIFDDVFDEMFLDAPDGDILVSDDDIDDAISESDRKIQYRLKATNDNWDIYPKQLADRYRRYLYAQRGGSFCCAVSVIASLTTYAGYMQVTADPLDTTTFDKVAKKDGRTRYASNSNGNFAIIMQLLFGDSGCGKSHVIKPLIRANDIAESAINSIDQATHNFFETIQLDNGKLLRVQDYAAMPGAVTGKLISSSEYSDIRAKLRSKDVYSFVHARETYTLSDYTADIAAIRDAMVDTETRLAIRDRTNGNLFAGTTPHPLFLMFDEGGAFIETTYQNSGRITSFCELKAGEPKHFRRARSNVSGQHMDIPFFGASMHANIPLPKFLSTAYRADVKDQKAEGVLGRITLGYLERNREIGPVHSFTDAHPDMTDFEYLTTIESFMMMIPNAMRRLEHDYPGKSMSYFYANRKTSNIYFDYEARDEMSRVHLRLQTKIEGMKAVYPDNSYAYDTYIGKLWEMIYTFSGGHKLMVDLADVAEKVIPLVTANLLVNGTVITYTGWAISEYIKDRGIQSDYNNTILLLSLVEALRELGKSSGLKPIRSRNITMASVKAAETIIEHHYDILTYSETLYWRHASGSQALDAAKTATTKATAERSSSSFLALRVVENLEKQIIKAISSKRHLRQSDVLRNMLHQAKTHNKPEYQRNTITATFNNLIQNLCSRGYLVPQGKTGQTWDVTGTLADIQPLLGELKASFMSGN